MLKNHKYTSLFIKFILVFLFIVLILVLLRG